MKLQEFFNTQKEISFTDIDKLDLYQNILYKKTKRNSLKRVSFVRTKYLVYSTVIALLLFGLYGVYFISDGTNKDYRRFAIRSSSTNSVQADYIAQVIEAKGNFFIEHDGILTTDTNISNGDTILLKQDTQLVFEIDSGVQSKIIGPAKLIVQKTENQKYKLNLVYGDFIQMEGTNQKSQAIELAINDITIKQQNTAEPVNFKFVKEGSNQIFQNNGGNIIVTKSNGTDKSTTISNQQVVAIQDNDIKVFANISSFTKAVQEKNVSQTFTLNTNPESTSSEKNTEQELVSLLNLLSTTKAIDSEATEVTKEITSVLGDDKKILDPEQDERISNSLYADFYNPELKELEKAFLEGDDTVFVSAYAKIEKRIQTVYYGLDESFTKNGGNPKEKLQDLITDIQTITQKITTDYNVPPTYSQNLQSISKFLNSILTKEYGSEAVHNAAEEQIIDTQESLSQ